ncbi:hypothetical protein PG993_008338 [Apiospora rasikravindrae]|uniref:Uncharacterized protein n=1 Tax=Apiospora rasikravindrae TaxID=990691 RepID=A0ABR1T017_9PEZI
MTQVFVIEGPGNGARPENATAEGNLKTLENRDWQGVLSVSKYTEKGREKKVTDKLCDRDAGQAKDEG